LKKRKMKMKKEEGEERRVKMKRDGEK